MAWNYYKTSFYTNDAIETSMSDCDYGIPTHDILFNGKNYKDKMLHKPWTGIFESLDKQQKWYYINSIRVYEHKYNTFMTKLGKLFYYEE